MEVANGIAQPGEDVENPRPSDGLPQNQREPTVGGCGESNLIKFLTKCLVYVRLTIVVATVIAALAVLTLPASVALLRVFLITYVVIILVSVGWRERDESYWNFSTHLSRCSAMVALLLLSSLSLVLVILRVHSSLKNRTIGGLEIWEWIVIALVFCVFCNIWIGGHFILTLVQKKCDCKEDVVYITSRIRRAVNCFCFVVAEVLIVRLVPSKRSVTFGGLESWKWILSLVSLLCGWNTIQAVTRLIVFSLEEWQNRFWKLRSNFENNGGGAGDHAGKMSTNKNQTVKKYAAFMAKGLRTRINVLLFFLLISVTWICYVEPRLHLESSSKDAKKALHFAIRSFLSLIVAAVVSLMMKFLLLLWEAREFYSRLAERIFRGYIQIYFLAKFCRSIENRKRLPEGQTTAPTDQRGPHPNDVSQSSAAMSRENGSRRSASQPIREVDRSPERSTEVVDRRSLMAQKNVEFNLRQLLEAAVEKVGTYDILQRATDAFLEQTVESSEVVELRTEWQKGSRDFYASISPTYWMITSEIADHDALADLIKEHYGYEFINGESACLYQQLEAEVDSIRNIEYADLEKWMEMAHKNCLEFANTLAGAHEALGYLNKTMIGILIVVWFVIWLFLIKIATTEIIIVATSPLLAATFIFGETAKTVFQGFVFAFAVHPFDVGDLCTIDGKKMEVKKMGIWKTAFYTNDSKKEEVLYPNSTLINTAIVKNKFNLDLDDSVEVEDVHFECEDYWKKKAVSDLRHKIESHMRANKDFEPAFSWVDEADLPTKIVVHIKHKNNFPYMSYKECLRKMNERRSDLRVKIKELLEAVKTEVRDETLRKTSTKTNIT